jgi:hypothetical protein
VNEVTEVDEVSEVSEVNEVAMVAQVRTCSDFGPRVGWLEAKEFRPPSSWKQKKGGKSQRE